MKRIISLALSFILLASSFSMLPFESYAQNEESKTLSEVALSDWMSAIQGNTKLTEITIPGTHDTCAKEFATANILTRIFKCQKETIPELLEDGVRYLDIRCETSKTTHSTKTVHSTSDCYRNGSLYYLDYVFKECYEFLDAHPSETILLQIKEDDGNVGAPNFTEAIYEYIHGYGQNKYFYGEDYNYHDYWYLSKSIPTLDEVRGKIVLFNRFDNDIQNSGSTVSEEESGQKVKWPDQTSSTYKSPVCEDYTDNNTGIGTIHVQDKYRYKSSDKINAIKETLALPHNKGEYYINFTSMNTGTEYPQSASEKINPQIKTLDFNNLKPSGIIPMDFVDETVTRPVIECNEAVSDIVTGSDESISFELNRKTKTLTISGSGEIKDFSLCENIGKNNIGVNAPWKDQITNSVFDYQFNSEIIENLVIEEGITSIGEYAFYDYDNLESISIPDSVTSINENAFNQSDDSALIAVDNLAKGLNKKDYSEESFEALESILTKSEKIIETENYPQLIIDNLCEKLLNAIYDLVPYLDFDLESEGGMVERSIEGSRLLFGSVISLHAIPEEGYTFVGWYESITKREIYSDEYLTFTLSSHTHLHAMFAKEGDATLICRNESGWTQKYITKTCAEWSRIKNLSVILPPVPYQKGYKNGYWDYDEAEVLQKLANGEDTVITPKYEFDWEEEIKIPVFNNAPVCELHFKEDTDSNVGIFSLAAGIPKNTEITEIGLLFKHGNKESFSSQNTLLMINNTNFNSKFFDKKESGIYVVDVLHFNEYNWAARGYINYLDENGKLKTAYSNQININQNAD
ncbi:MAG: leucine-rich repeat protein [Eubacterium sp.]|nr:leucine-rich repeat protein [Eubacterium sp.]